MPVQLLCPNFQCGKTYSVSDETAGRRWKCRHCGTRLDGAFQDAGANDTNDALKGSSISDQSSHPSQQAELPTQIGPYQIRKSLGSGAFGQVFLAYDPKLDRQVALKVPHPGVLNSAKATERFLREAKAGARLHHANIVTVFDAGQDGLYHYIASVYIKGQTLQDALEKGPWDFRRSAEAVRQLALALAYAHKQGIVHRDVKPANILQDEFSQLYLTDFGIASLMDASEKLTQTGAMMGTSAYMAPEVGQGSAGKTDPACDQYSLGVLLYELLCNQLPFTGMPGYVIHCHIHQAPKPPREILGTIPPALEAICIKAMAKKPADRYVDCKAMADALQKWLVSPPAVILVAQVAPEPNEPRGDPRPETKAATTTAGGRKRGNPNRSKETGQAKDGNPFVFDSDEDERRSQNRKKTVSPHLLIGLIGGGLLVFLVCGGTCGYSMLGRPSEEKQFLKEFNKVDAGQPTVVGSWEEVGGARWEFRSDGTGSINDVSFFKYRQSGDQVTMNYPNIGTTIRYRATRSGDLIRLENLDDGFVTNLHNRNPSAKLEKGSGNGGGIQGGMPGMMMGGAGGGGMQDGMPGMMMGGGGGGMMQGGNGGPYKK